MTLRPVYRALAAIAFFALAAPAWTAGDGPDPPSVSDMANVSEARALVEGGRFEETLSVLRPLARDDPENADGLAAMEIAGLASGGLLERVACMRHPLFLSFTLVNIRQDER